MWCTDSIDPPLKDCYKSFECKQLGMPNCYEKSKLFGLLINIYCNWITANALSRLRYVNGENFDKNWHTPKPSRNAAR